MASLDPAAVAALVPCHEEPPDERLLDEIASHVGSVLVVADGLPHGAQATLQRVADAHGLHVLRLPRRSGKGTAVAAGVEWLLQCTPPPEAVLVVDGDGQHPPDAIPRFIEAGQSADLVIGDRFGDLGSMPLMRRFANVVTCGLVAAAGRARVRDTQCGMRLMRAEVLREVPPPVGEYEAETTHLRRCLAAGLGVAWLPIPALYGAEPSSFRPVRDGIKVLQAAVRPLHRAGCP
jgi:glycosyltransferase involved in cell wall biosynthesis